MQVEIELEQPTPVISPANPLDTTWNVDQPRDSDDNWPTAAMYGNQNGTNGNGQHSGNQFNYNADGGFPTLLSTNRNYGHSSGFPPPRNGPSGSGAGFGAPAQWAPATRNYTMTPTASLYGAGAGAGSGFGFNPAAPRYVPREQHMVDPIVRPESSISNQSSITNHTFATQLPRGHMGMGDMAAPAPRRNYPQAFGNGMNSLGAGLNNLSIKDHQPYGAPTSINEGSMQGLNKRNGVLTRRDSFSEQTNFSSHGRAPSSRFLAEEIISGKTEDLNDRNMNRYDSAPKQPAPQMGPARFKDSKMFSTADRNVSAAAVEQTNTIPHQQLPPPPKPDWLDLAMQGMMKPTLDEAFESLPLTELPRTINQSTAGVVRIGDIPYVATKQELIAFVGRQAQINRMPLGSPYHAVHIMMERESGKTLDCFIEFATVHEANWVVRQLNHRTKAGRPPKVGDRTVQVLNSTQDELMAELFPRAKHVRWNGGQPIVDNSKREYYQSAAADGFNGFLHSEEFHAMVKHAGLNERAPFASKSPCRVYEMMITVLYKYPWYAVDLVTVRERRSIFDTAASLIRTLCEHLRRSDGKFKPLDPTPALLQELISAALYCPGFSEKQKAHLSGIAKNNGFASMADGRSVNIAPGGNHPLAPHWPFSALSFLPGTDYKLVQYYASLFREASSAIAPPGYGSGSLAARQMAKSTGYDMPPMGRFSINYGADIEKLTMAEVAKIEYNKIEQLLSIVCYQGGRGNDPPSAPHSVGPDYGNGRGSTGSSGEARSLF